MGFFTGNYFEEDFDTYDREDWLTGTWSNAGNSWNHASTRAENVTHDAQDGTLTMRLGSENDRGKEYNGASVQTQDFFHFGIYEINMKASGVQGVNSNFFTFTGSQQGTIKNEIDFEFLGKTPTKVWTSFHSPIANDPSAGYKGRGKNVDLGFDASKDFHTYRFEWKPDSIKWYADGRLIRSVDPEKDVWLEDGEYHTSYTAAGEGDTGAEIGIPQLPGKMYMNIWAGATSWMGNTPADFKETTASYDNIRYMSWNHPDAKSLEGGEPWTEYEIIDVEEPTEETADVAVPEPEDQGPAEAPVQNNAAPEAGYDTAVVEENGSVIIDVLSNDIDPDGDILRVSNVANVTNGKVKINDDGSVTFTPDEGFSGRVDFSYTVTDGDKSSTGWVGVDVQEATEAEPVEQPEVVEETPAPEPEPEVVAEAPAPAPQPEPEVVEEAPAVAEPEPEVEEQEPVVVKESGEYDIAGTSGEDRLRGSAKDEVFFDTAGQDRMWGSGGDDTFVFSKNTAFDGKDLIKDFRDGDTVDISDLLVGYDPAKDNLAEFIDVRVKNGFTILSIDMDGEGNYRDIAKIQNTNLSDDVNQLVQDDVLDIGTSSSANASSSSSSSSSGSGSYEYVAKESADSSGFNLDSQPVVKSVSGKITLGAGGRDIIKGTDGDDVINGQSGDNVKDKLYGNDGDDVLIGGYNDVLNGGAGKDTFVLENGSTKHTRIEDFKLGEDMIDISDVLKDVDTVGDMISDFVSIETNTNQGKTYLVVDQDGNGGAGAQIVAQVDGLLNMNVAELMSNDSLIV